MPQEYRNPGSGTNKSQKEIISPPLLFQGKKTICFNLSLRGYQTEFHITPTIKPHKPPDSKAPRKSGAFTQLCHLPTQPLAETLSAPFGNKSSVFPQRKPSAPDSRPPSGAASALALSLNFGSSLSSGTGWNGGGRRTGPAERGCRYRRSSARELMNTLIKGIFKYFTTPHETKSNPRAGSGTPQRRHKRHEGDRGFSVPTHQSRSRRTVGPRSFHSRLPRSSSGTGAAAGRGDSRRARLRGSGAARAVPGGSPTTGSSILNKQREREL